MRKLILLSSIFFACDSRAPLATSAPNTPATIVPSTPCGDTVGPLAQGPILQTADPTDLALMGPGFFILQGASDRYYSRWGAFAFDDKGRLVNGAGYPVLGFPGENGTTLGALDFGNAPIAPQPTSMISLQANLQSSAPIVGAFDATQPSRSSNFSTSTTIYDSTGNAIDVSIFFCKTDVLTWQWHSLTGPNPTAIYSGDLLFDNTGKLQSSDQNAVAGFAPLGTSQPLMFNFGDPTDAGGTGLAGITEFAADGSSLTFAAQDGNAEGKLAQITIDDAGIIEGAFTNGATKVLAQLAVATFAVPQALSVYSKDQYQLTLADTSEAGAPSIDRPTFEGRGVLIQGALEELELDDTACSN